MAWGLFRSVKKGLTKTRNKLSGALNAILTIGRKIDDDVLDEIEEALILSDLGPRLAMEITEDIRAKYKAREIRQVEEIFEFLQSDLSEKLLKKDIAIAMAHAGPTVIMLVGVNGTGKTTTAAKLAHRLRRDGCSVLLAAADTFRAAAGEQLDIWAGRIGVEIIRHKDGSDPAAVVFDACEAARARKLDYVVIDTAGRIHTKENLMRELQKIHRVASQKIEGAPHEVLLVLDATTGQNALSQAKTFAQGVGLTGLVLTKLDGTAKGGIAIAINREVELPIKLIGVGEGAEDLVVFDPEAYVAAMFAGIETEETVDDSGDGAAAPEDNGMPQTDSAS